jgi:metal-responsive CopG/Arc/MetJ family transcriptional regulator
MCYTVAMAPTTPIHARVNTEVLRELERLGQEARPKPLNRSEMINVAIRDYVERHAKAEPAPKRRGAA